MEQEYLEKVLSIDGVNKIYGVTSDDPLGDEKLIGFTLQGLRFRIDTIERNGNKTIVLW